MGLGRFELPTPRLSSVCSNQLSYRPGLFLLAPLRMFASLTSWPRSARLCFLAERTRDPCLSHRTVKEPRASTLVPSKLDRRAHQTVVGARSIIEKVASTLAGVRKPDSRKEVIQPQVLLQLPCYDFTPITNHTLGTGLPCGLAPLLLVQPAFVM